MSEQIENQQESINVAKEQALYMASEVGISLDEAQAREYAVLRKQQEFKLLSDPELLYIVLKPEQRPTFYAEHQDIDILSLWQKPSTK